MLLYFTDGRVAANKKKLSPDQIKARERLCDTYLADSDRRNLLVFCDEKLFKRNQNKSRVCVRRRRGTAYDLKNINYYGATGGHADVNAFMFITRNGKGGLLLAEKGDLYDQSARKIRVPAKGEKLGFDGDSYYELMRDHVLPSLDDMFGTENYEWMHDNAPIHTSENLKRNPGKTVKQLLADRGIQLVDWPANSPDLNPVEHVWAMLNRSVKLRLRRMTKLPKNKAEHWTIIRQCFSRLDNAKIIKIFESFTRRLQVVKAKGGMNNNRY